MIRKIICGVINTLSVLVIAAAIVILCMVLFTEPGKPPNIFGFTMLRITTGSMEPTYATDTLLVVKKTDPKEIMEGDVISFYSTDPALEGAVNTHRVVAISQDGDNYIYTTKGDANNAADLYDAQSRYLIGKVILVIAFSWKAFASGSKSVNLYSAYFDSTGSNIDYKPCPYSSPCKNDCKGGRGGSGQRSDPGTSQRTRTKEVSHTVHRLHPAAY